MPSFVKQISYTLPVKLEIFVDETSAKPDEGWINDEILSVINSLLEQNNDIFLQEANLLEQYTSGIDIRLLPGD